jgi:signal transduction histidine kinase
VRLIVRGEVGPLDPGLELTAFWLVQEGRANARRHAPGAAVDVELDYGADALRVPTDGAEPHGLGLRGMSERAAMVGGELCVGSLARGWLHHH